MKKRCLMILCFMFFAGLVSSGAVGISPAYFKEFFEPGLEKVYVFETMSADSNQELKIYVEGDLKEYIFLSEEIVVGQGKVEARMKLPDYIERPGTHSIFIGAIEHGKQIGGDMMIGGIASVQARIDILVPYPGVYLEHAFSVGSINEGEKAKTELKLDNLGTEDIRVFVSMKVYDKNETNVLLNKKLEDFFLKTKESKTIKEDLNTENFEAGEYFVVLTLEYGGKVDKTQKDFKIGTLYVDIIDYSFMFEKGRISPFLIEVESKWNSRIDKVYAEVSITDEGKLLQKFQTPSVSLSPWERKNLTSYIETTDFESKRYTASMRVFYEDSSTNKLVAIYVYDSPKKEILPYAVAGAVLLIALISIIFLVIKIKKLEHGK